GGTLPIVAGGGSAGGVSPGADGGVTSKDAGGTGGTTGGTDAGAPACNPGDVCAPGYRCGGGTATSCMDCTCGADGHLSCMPCPDKPDGGGAGATSGGTGGTTGGGSAGTGGTATGPCNVMPMLATDVGLPCGVMESCPDGSNYRVRCDGVTGSCTCFANGTPAPSMPTMSCTGFDP